jgi:hypothetical protein
MDSIVDQLFRNRGIEILDRLSSGILCLDDGLCIVYANSRFLELFGCTSREVAGRPLAEFIGISSLAEACGHVAAVDRRGETLHLLVSASPLGEHQHIMILQEIGEMVAELREASQRADGLQQRLEKTFGSGEFIPLCSVCGKIRLADGTWVFPINLQRQDLAGVLTHGYCPLCAKNMLEEYRRERERLRGGGGEDVGET